MIYSFSYVIFFMGVVIFSHRYFFFFLWSHYSQMWHVSLVLPCNVKGVTCWNAPLHVFHLMKFMQFFPNGILYVHSGIERDERLPIHTCLRCFLLLFCCFICSILGAKCFSFCHIYYLALGNVWISWFKKKKILSYFHALLIEITHPKWQDTNVIAKINKNYIESVSKFIQRCFNFHKTCPYQCQIIIRLLNTPTFNMNKV